MFGKKGPFDMPVNDDYYTPDSKSKEKAPGLYTGPLKMHDQIIQLETRVDLLEGAIRHARLCQDKDICEIGQLQRHLTVKKLAQGKSLGALGLPSEEEWNQGL